MQPDYPIRSRLWIGFILLGVFLGLGSACQSAAAEEDLRQVSSLTINGNRAFSTGRVESLMRTRQTPWYEWMPGVSRKAFDPAVLEADLLRIVAAYRDTGYLETAIDTLIDRSRTGEAGVTVLITEGSVTQVTRLVTEGLNSPDMPRIAPDRFLTQPGHPLIRSRIERDRQAILKQLRNAGYAFATVSARSEVNREAHTAEVTLRAEPGKRYRFGGISVQGNRRVGTGTIRRGIAFRSGRRFSQDLLLSSRRQLYRSGAFRSVALDVPDSLARSDSLTVVLRITERDVRTIRIGAAYDTENRFQGEVEWSHRSLFGGAQKLRVLASGSAIEKEFSATLRQPYVFSSKNWLYGRAFLTETMPTDSLEQTEIGADVALERNVRSQTSLLVQISGGLIDFSADSAFSEFRVTFRDDRRDDILDPKMGSLVTVSARQKGYFLSTKREFLQFQAEGRWYRRMPLRSVLAGRVQGGFTIELVESTTPGVERFFAGGLSSVRGWGYNDLGPRDSLGNPVGGLSKFEGSVELRTLLGAYFGAVVFIDAGNVGERLTAFELDALAWAAGFGLRYLSPVGPIRFDAGKRLTEDAFSSLWHYHVSLGQAF